MALAGILGFAMSGSVLGIFMAGTALSTVWLVAGVVTLAIALWAPAHASLWAKIAGIVLVVVGVWGFVVQGAVLGALDNTTANNVLHLVLGVLFLWIGFVPMGHKAAHMPPAAPMQGTM